MNIRRSYVRGFRFLLYSFFILMVVASVATAQTTTAAFQGTVTDTSGAVIPAAQVTASNVETGLKRTTTTNEAGRVLLSELPPGSDENTGTPPGVARALPRGRQINSRRQRRIAWGMKYS